MITALCFLGAFSGGLILSRWVPFSRTTRQQRQYNRRVKLIQAEVRKTDEAMRRIVVDSWRWSR